MIDSRLPTLDTGEPVLARWFVLVLLVLVPLGVGLIVWAFVTVDREPLPVEERRPPGTAQVTHDRGRDPALNQDRTVEPGPGCASGVDVIGDRGARAAGTRALGAVCQLLDREAFATATAGLQTWVERGGILRFATFRLSGVDASTRVEDGRVIIELNAKWQFLDATEAAPVVIHELVHLAGPWPGAPVTAEGELEAMRAQFAACDLLTFGQQPPRGCFDAQELLALDDPVGALVDAGFPNLEAPP